MSFKSKAAALAAFGLMAATMVHAADKFDFSAEQRGRLHTGKDLSLIHI